MILCIDMARGKENTHDVLWCISRLEGENLLNKALFHELLGGTLQIWYQSVVFVELYCVAL